METILFPDYVLDDTLDDYTPDDDNGISDNNDDDDNDNNYDKDNDGKTMMMFQTMHFLFTHVYVHR